MIAHVDKILEFSYLNLNISKFRTDVSCINEHCDSFPFIYIKSVMDLMVLVTGVNKKTECCLHIPRSLLENLCDFGVVSTFTGLEIWLILAWVWKLVVM